MDKKKLQCKKKSVCMNRTPITQIYGNSLVQVA